MPALVHPTATVGPQVVLADDVQIGAGCVLSGVVEIGPGCVIEPYTIIEGCCRIGRNCRIGPHACIGGRPQDRKYAGQPTWLVVGDGVEIREFCSVHRATQPGEEHATRIGSGCMLMAFCHIGHDCVLAEDVTLISYAGLSGHCRVERAAVLGGQAAMHQHCRIGRLAMAGGGAVVQRDIPPFAMCVGSMLRGYNRVGCRRAGMSAEQTHAIRRAYSMLASDRILSRALRRMEAELGEVPVVREILDFYAGSKRGVMNHHRSRYAESKPSGGPQEPSSDHA